jgi:hypothetical protein
MSFVPLVLAIIGVLMVQKVEICSWKGLFVSITIFSILYALCFWKLSMTTYERELIGKPVMQLLRRI